MEICFKDWKWDNLGELIQVGPRPCKVKPWVKTWSLPGGGWKGAIVVALGPLRWSEHHHKVVVVGDGSVQQGTAEPAAHFWAMWGPMENLQKWNKGGLSSWAMTQQTLEIQEPDSKYTIL